MYYMTVLCDYPADWSISDFKEGSTWEEIILTPRTKDDIARAHCHSDLKHFCSQAVEENLKKFFSINNSTVDVHVEYYCPQILRSA